jgi:hypothetical protein
VAFESEQAWWYYRGEHDKDWSKEFKDLCDPTIVSAADLRVLASAFPYGTGERFKADLPSYLAVKKSGLYPVFARPDDQRSLTDLHHRTEQILERLG